MPSKALEGLKAIQGEAFKCLKSLKGPLRAPKSYKSFMRALRDLYNYIGPKGFCNAQKPLRPFEGNFKCPIRKTLPECLQTHANPKGASQWCGLAVLEPYSGF